MLNHSQGVVVNGGFLTHIEGDSHSYHHGEALTFYTAMDSSKRQLVTKIETQVQNHG